MFLFCLFFSLPSLPFLEKSPMFFYLVALINLFSKIGSMSFFFNVFFYRPPSLDFGFFLIQNREIEQSGLNITNGSVGVGTIQDTGNA